MIKATDGRLPLRRLISSNIKLSALPNIRFVKQSSSTKSRYSDGSYEKEASLAPTKTNVSARASVALECLAYKRKEQFLDSVSESVKIIEEFRE
jgi:hypothetical protein